MILRGGERHAFAWLGLTLLIGSAHCATSESSGSGQNGSVDGLFPADGGADGSGIVRACSGDMQSVLDEGGSEVERCSPDQGCAGGRCVPACDAAAANKGSLGCSYTVATPSFFADDDQKPPCFAIFVANGWGKAATINVSRGGQTFDVTKFARTPVAGESETEWPLLTTEGLPPGGVAVMFMSSDPNSRYPGGDKLTCPVPPALDAATAVMSTGKGTAWRITSDVPLTAYDIIPYGGSRSFLPSAELLFPTTAWGNNYVAVVPPAAPGPRPSVFWGQIVAAEDGTTVDLLASTALPGGGGVPAAPANQVTKLTLNAGEYIQFEGSGELSGSVISSNKPVAFTGGDTYMCYRSQTSTGGGCDSGHQQIPHVAAMASEYVAAPYATRMSSDAPESVSYRIMGVVDGTTLTYDPPLEDGPTSIGAGRGITFETKKPFRVTSQDAAHPFYMAQIMTGAFVTLPRAGGQNGELGDEEFVNLVPPAQFLRKYPFFTDPSYGTTNLTLTRLKTNGAFHDVSVKCIGKVSGWSAIGTRGDAEFTTVELVRDGRGIGNCSNGAQLAESDGAFGVTVWGLDKYASYAYPAGGNLAPINAVVVPSMPR